MIGPRRIVSPDAPQPRDMLDRDGVLRLRPAADYDRMDPDGLRLWCHHNARYGLPTTETVAWLREFIGGRSAVEIGAGHGDLARHLGVPATDNKCQEFPDVRLLYRAQGQPTIAYPAWVEKIDALDAVLEQRPQVVVGSWVTQWIDPSKGADAAYVARRGRSASVISRTSLRRSASRNAPKPRAVTTSACGPPITLSR
jgi:hypothetical protein